MLPFLARIDRALGRFEMATASVALGVALVMALYTVAARALRIPTSEWVLELPMELLVVISIFATGALIREERHLSVDLFVARLPGAWRRRLDLGRKWGLAAVSALLAERAATASLQSARAGLRLPELFDLPTAVPLAVASFGFAIWSLHYVFGLTASVRSTS